MAHDVFISHAHKDKNIANAICQKLESAKVKCWIAERDIYAGEDWTEATRKAIGSSRAMVLVLSDNANSAPHIEREIAHAFYTKRAILPVRLTKTPPRRDFLFYLNDVSWFDASNPPEGQYLEALVASVTGMINDRPVARAGIASSVGTPPRGTFNFSDSWLGGFQASHYRTVEILKGVSIAVAFFSLMWVLWYAYSEWKGEGFPEGDNLRATNHGQAAAVNSSHRPAGDASPSQPGYTYSRFGLWVSPKNSPTSTPQESVPAANSTPTVQSGVVSATPAPNLDQNANGKTEKSSGGDSAYLKSTAVGSADFKSTPEQTPETTNSPAPVAKAADPSTAAKVEPTPGEPESDKFAGVDKSPSGTVLPTPSAAATGESTSTVDPTPAEKQVANGVGASSEEQTLKGLVLDYLRTVASDDNSLQERFFSWRVNFYGKGLLSLSEVRASMESYRRQWPVRNWEPTGEPEFPKILHATHPELYEVLQPFDWSVGNGSQSKKGSAMLYVRIRKDDKGQLHIIHLEQRHPGDQRENDSP
jgi:hypothetical protein